MSAAPDAARRPFPGRDAVLIVEEAYAPLVAALPHRVLVAPPGAAPTALLAEAGPDHDVLVLAADETLLTAAPVTAAGRTVFAAGAGSAAEARRIAAALARPSRPVEERLLAAGPLVLTESLSGSLARVGAAGEQAGPAGGRSVPGAVRLLPPTWLVLDTVHSLGTVTGAVTVKGRPVVTGGEPGERRAVHDRLTPLVRLPVVLGVGDGRARVAKAVQAGSDGAAATLAGVFAEDPDLARVTAVAYGAPGPGDEPALHLVLGGHRGRLRLALPCATTTVRAVAGGPVLAGPAPRPLNHLPKFRTHHTNKGVAR
ncbi:hypothetical protein ACFUJU_27260 [Streptomyces sp. NPDC057235]|uniref:hypothetical protein n=1 Tax=Streptomyces sp. NPDC057235 TaxID=3346058 RepID=UPI0036367C7D